MLGKQRPAFGWAAGVELVLLFGLEGVAAAAIPEAAEAVDGIAWPVALTPGGYIGWWRMDWRDSEWRIGRSFILVSNGPARQESERTQATFGERDRRRGLIGASPLY